MSFFRQWGTYPSDIWPIWERVLYQGRDDDGRFTQDIFPILQRALTEGQEQDRLFALFLLGALATSEARELLLSFLTSESRKERWVSAISLGRLKDERVFAVLQTLLLEGFAADTIFARSEDVQRAQEICHDYRYTEQEREILSEAFWGIIERLERLEYEWYLRQRAECALVLGAWDNPVVVLRLKEALQAAWNMEQAWPNYAGPDESGPGIWHFFQDRLAFALGQLVAWDALSSIHLPPFHLHVARIYLVLGALQVNDLWIFYENSPSTLFRDSPAYLQERATMKRAGIGVLPFVEPAPVKQLLAEHFGLSQAEQEAYLMQFPTAWYGRSKRASTSTTARTIDDW